MSGRDKEVSTLDCHTKKHPFSVDLKELVIICSSHLLKKITIIFNHMIISLYVKTSDQKTPTNCNHPITLSNNDTHA